MPTQENMATPTIDERLILLVQNYKELYDKTGSYYKDKELKENIWTSIATELDIDGEWQDWSVCPELCTNIFLLEI